MPGSYAGACIANERSAGFVTIDVDGMGYRHGSMSARRGTIRYPHVPAVI